MAACMVTCGRGLDDFVWEEILQKIPDATDLRHLGEGKITFKVGQNLHTCTSQGLENVSDENDERKTFRQQKMIKEARNEIVGTSACPKEFWCTNRILKNQPSGISPEEANLLVAALSHIFKLRLVERVFILLHCEDVHHLSCSTRSSEAEHQAGDGHLSADDIRKDCAALSPKPLSLRPYIPHLTLRSTISNLMARLSQLPQKATVLDPMCGGGSILVETAMSFDVSHMIASDSSQEQLEVARCNLHHLKVSVTLLQASAERLPLQDSSINTVLCDFPFGHKYKLTMKGQQLLAGVLKEMYRVLVCGGRAVFLLSPRQHDALCQVTKTSSPTSNTGDCLTLQGTHPVSLGETSAYVAVMFKEHPYIGASREKENSVLSVHKDDTVYWNEYPSTEISMGKEKCLSEA